MWAKVVCLVLVLVPVTSALPAASQNSFISEMQIFQVKDFRIMLIKNEKENLSTSIKFEMVLLNDSPTAIPTTYKPFSTTMTRRLLSPETTTTTAITRLAEPITVTTVAPTTTTTFPAPSTTTTIPAISWHVTTDAITTPSVTTTTTATPSTTTAESTISLTSPGTKFDFISSTTPPPTSLESPTTANVQDSIYEDSSITPVPLTNENFFSTAKMISSTTRFPSTTTSYDTTTMTSSTTTRAPSTIKSTTTRIKLSTSKTGVKTTSSNSKMIRCDLLTCVSCVLLSTCVFVGHPFLSGTCVDKHRATRYAETIDDGSIQLASRRQCPK